jgi:hypothetical protein
MRNILIAALHRVLAGDVIEFPRKKREPGEDKDKWMDYDVEKLRERFKDNPKVLERLEKAIDPSKNAEPYIGHPKMGTKWGDDYDKETDIDFPLPANVGDLQGVLGKDVLMGGSDPFVWADTKYKVTKKLLQKNWDNPLEIHTRSNLIAHDDYIKVLNPNKHKVFIHIVSTDDAINKELEPHQPSARRRLGAAKKLQESLIPVTIAHDIFENKNLIPDVEKLQKLDDLKMRKEGKGLKVKQMPVKISDKAAEIINDTVKVHFKKAAASILASLIRMSKKASSDLTRRG